MKDFSIERKHTAIDTETIEGKAVMICSPNRYLYRPKYFEDIAHFLFTLKAKEAHHIWTFNLTYDATAILKFIPYENIKEIYDTNETIYNGYKIFFIPGKLFSISRKGDKSTLVDSAQFFQSSLDNAAKTFLNEEKDDNKIIDFFKYQDIDIINKTPEKLYKYLDENKDVLIKYCQKDAYLTMKLGEKIDLSCYETYGFKLETYSSNAKIGEKATLNYCGTHEYQNNENKTVKGINFPACFEKSKCAMYAQASYRGGIFETWQRGSFDTVTDFDVNSAYPFQMIDLPHWGNGSFIEITDINYDDIASGKHQDIYKYGWVACEFDCSYIPYPIEKKEMFELVYNGEDIDAEVKNKKIFYPDGKRQQFITLAEYYFMQKYNFKCHIMGGFVWVQKKTQFNNPFGWIPEIYNKKTEIKRKLGKDAKKDMNYLQCKIGMNGAYGKTVQKIGEHRNLYNPFYGSYITAGCRIQIASFILDNHYENKILNIATDGLLLKGNIEYPSSDLLGRWEVNHYDNTLIIGNGMLQLNDKKGIHSKLRGITNKNNFDVLKLLSDNKDKDSVLFEKSRPLKIGEMIAHNKKFGFNDLNKFIKFGRKIKVNADKKRNWKQLNNFDELLNCQIKGKKWTIKQIEEKINPDDIIDDGIRRGD